MIRPASFILAASAAILYSPVISAQVAPHARLTYVRAANAFQCADETALRDSVSAYLGYDPFVPTAPVRVNATIQRTARGFRANIELRDADDQVTGSRAIDSAHGDCTELASAMTLAISLAIDPFRTGQRTNNSAAPISPRVDTPSPPPTLPPNSNADLNRVATTLASPSPGSSSAVDIAPAPPSVRASVSVGVAASILSLPSFSMGPTAGIAFRWKIFSVGLEGRGEIQVVSVAGPSGGRITSELALATLVPCVHYRVASACVLASVGALVGRGFDVIVANQQVTAYSALGARAAFEFPLHERLRLRLYGELSVPLVRTTLGLNGSNVWISDAVSVLLGTALAFNL